MGLRRLVAAPDAAGEKLERWLVRHAPGMTTERARELLAAGRVRIRGKLCRPGRILAGGDDIELDVPPPRPLLGATRAGPDLPLLFDDEHLVAVDKPPGLNTEPEGDWPSVVSLLAGRAGPFDVDGVAAPGVVHRLDRWTSGCLALARTDEALAGLQRAFLGKQVEKTYLALVLGEPPDAERLEGPYGRDPTDRRRYTTRVASPRRAALSYKVRHRFRTPEGPLALAEIRLETGRTHQIRVQLQDAGYPVLADPVYGPQAARAHPAAHALGRLALHAWRLALPHPITGSPLAFEAPPPADYEAALALLRGR